MCKVVQKGKGDGENTDSVKLRQVLVVCTSVWVMVCLVAFEESFSEFAGHFSREVSLFVSLVPLDMVLASGSARAARRALSQECSHSRIQLSCGSELVRDARFPQSIEGNLASRESLVSLTRLVSSLEPYRCFTRTVPL